METASAQPLHILGTRTQKSRSRIRGGTDQIQRDIIGERILGLPGDIRVDEDVPSTDIPTGS